MKIIKKVLSWWTRSEREAREKRYNELHFQNGKSFAEKEMKTSSDKEAAIKRLENFVVTSRYYEEYDAFDRGIDEAIREFRREIENNGR